MTTQLRVRATLHRFERAVVAAVQTQGLFRKGEHVLVAVSGGPDSVALLAVLVALAPAWRLTLSAWHGNYGLRGNESEEDEGFVARLCADWRVPLIRERIVLHGGARANSSLQARARAARYEALQRAADAQSADAIATGHTVDDQAETLVMRLLRGSGAAGLSGIRPRHGRIIRPLLNLDRAAVLAYLKDKGQAFRTDSSNATPVYLRNRVRHELLPLLARFNPAVVDALARTAEIFRDDDVCLQHMALDWMSRHVRRTEAQALTVSRTALLQLPVALQRRVLRELARETAGSTQGPTFGPIDAVLKRVVNGRTGTSLSLGRVCMVRDYDTIRMAPASSQSWERMRAIPLAIPSEILWPLTSQVVRISLTEAPVEKHALERNIVRFDADRFTHRLTLRSWQIGDAFQPSGMGGRRKKLQDYFSDIKLPREQRSRVPLVVAPEGILWIVGHRTDHRFGVTATTQRVLTVEVGPIEAAQEGRG